jgi:uncharacterized protein (DUF362 family)
MSDLSRRDFLRLAALGLGALVVEVIVAACKGQTTISSLPTGSPGPTTAPATELATPTAVPSPSAGVTPSLAAASPTQTEAALPDVVVASKGDPEPLVQAAIAALGGMERFVPRGANVIVKPNVCVSGRSYQYAATTNPWVVGTLVKMALDAGAASVKVMDNPFSGSGSQAYASSGIASQVQAAGGQMVVMSSHGFVDTAIPKGKWLRQAAVYEDILKADVIINVPIAKDHGTSRMTAGMKNLMGLVDNPGAMHGSLHQAIADLNTLIRPTLTVVDCVRILMSGGPQGGDLNDVKKLDTVIASADVVAADTYAATFFGFKPDDIGYLKIGTAMGLGQSDLSKLTISKISV